jgi:hypothetical protein
MSDKQYLGRGSTKDSLDAALDWNAAIERQAGKKLKEGEAGDPPRRDTADDRKREKSEGAAAGSEVPDLDQDSAGDRGC